MPSTTEILTLGGSGRVGSQVITDALARGHKVTALVRKPDSIAPQPNLTLVVGSPTSSASITKALHTISERAGPSNSQTQVTIITTLGQTRVNQSNPWSAPTSPALFMSESAQAVIDALRATTTGTAAAAASSNISIQKFMILSAFGAGDSWPHLHWALKWVMDHSNMRQTLEDQNEVTRVVGANLRGNINTTNTNQQDSTSTSKLPIPYLVVRPVMLKFGATGPISEVQMHGHGEEGMGMLMKCDIRSVSAFMLDKAVEKDLDGAMPVISN